ncbi:MAG: hypothetical protein IKY76_08735 [Alistipes sp.]|nr:hypothetical protein [Alistipes sp.]
MNTEKFKTLLKVFCADNSISSDVIDQWCDIVSNNYHMFKDKDYDGISEVLSSLVIDGIDERVVGHSASIIAYDEDAEMNTDKGCCTVFMTYSKANDK